MYTIVMNDDKSLSASVRQNIYQGESLVNKMQFLLPSKYDEIDLSGFTVYLKYIVPGNIGCVETLTLSDELYKETLLRYYLPVDSKLTKFAGDVVMCLSLVKTDEENNKKYIMKTGSTTVTIEPTQFCYSVDLSGCDDCDDGFAVVEF